MAGGLQTLAHDQEHRDARAVLRRVPDLLGLVLVGVEAGLHRVPHRALAAGNVEAIDRGRHGERGEQVERAGAVVLAADVGDGAERRQFDLAQRLAVEAEAPQQRVRVLFVAREELSADDVQRSQHGIGLRNDFAPVLARGRGRPAP